MEASHFGITPNGAIELLKTALSALVMSTDESGTTTGVLRTVERVESDTIEAINRILPAGCPAVLLYYAGGPFAPQNIGKQKYDHDMTIRVIAAVSTEQSRGQRMFDSEMDPDNSTAPGVDNVLDWAVYLCMRALIRDSDVQKVQLGASRPSFTLGEKYVSAVDIIATRDFDLHDDSIEATLLYLGIVHSPVDYDQLFDEDGNPYSEWPRTVDGGVAEL